MEEERARAEIFLIADPNDPHYWPTSISIQSTQQGNNRSNRENRIQFQIPPKWFPILQSPNPFDVRESGWDQ